MKVSKTLSVLSVLGLAAGIFVLGGEDTSAMQQQRQKHYKMKMSKMGQGRIHSHTIGGETTCVRTHKKHITCTSEVQIEIGA